MATLAPAARPSAFGVPVVEGEIVDVASVILLLHQLKYWRPTPNGTTRCTTG
jgi:hypothetical protein